MRVLFMVHRFLPAHRAGTEVYTAGLARALARRGHAVSVFCAEKDVSRTHLSLERRTWEGIEVHELVNNLFYDDFRETYAWPAAEQVFSRVLDLVRPDVLHAMHVLYLSAGCVAEAARRGIPVCFTLHDFWLTCARFGQRRHPDGGRCDTIDFARCGTCLSALAWRQSPFTRATARAIAGVRSATGVDLGAAARGAAGILQSRESEPVLPAQDDPRARAMAQAARERERALREELVPHVTRFLAPSRFLLERFLEWGLPAARLEHVPYAIDLAPFRALERPSSDKLRVGFLGTLAPHKGPHLLIEAWGLLSASLREKAELSLHGPREHPSDYVAGLTRAAGRVGARLRSALERAEVPRFLAALDLLVVPSTWYENQPLVILEALAARTPVLVSDLGGMAELVEEGRGGWRFRVGDAADLARVLERLLAQPTMLSSVAPCAAPPRDIEEHAGLMEERYRAVLAGLEP